MKRTIAGLAIVALSVWASSAQGTIQFMNSALSRLMYNEVVPPPAGTHVGAYWGTDAAGPLAIMGIGRGTLAGPTSLTAAGGIWPAPGAPGGPVYPVMGTQEGQRVWLKIAAWIGGDSQAPVGFQAYGESIVVSVVLGPTAGPGTVVWQGSAGTATDRAKPFVMIPEPSVIALGLLGVGALLLRRRTG